MNHDIEQTNQKLREALRQELIVGGYDDNEATQDLITSFMPARLIVAIQEQEQVQRIWMDRAADVPEGPARTTFLNMASLRQTTIDHLRHLQNARYGS